MTSISNMKIGKKITLVLGVVMLLLAGLSAVSLWGIRTNEKAAITLAQRLTKARLAGSVQGDTSAITMNLARMVLSGKRSSENTDRIQELRKSRTAALEQFVAMADTPTSVKHGADMAELVQSQQAANDRVLAALGAGRGPDAAKEFRSAFSLAEALYAKGNEASQFQVTRASEAEQARKQTSTTILISLIAGCLIALAGAIMGGVILTRGIASPIGIFVTHLGRIASGDLSQNAPAEFLSPKR